MSHASALNFAYGGGGHSNVHTSVTNGIKRQQTFHFYIWVFI
mgnify:CR=1 FL=1